MSLGRGDTQDAGGLAVWAGESKGGSEGREVGVRTRRRSIPPRTPALDRLWRAQTPR